VTLRAIALLAACVSAPTVCSAQPAACSADASVNVLAGCLTNNNPAIRDGIAFETLSKRMRSGSLDVATLRALKDRLLVTVTRGGSALETSFPALTLGEVARTDRVNTWMTDAERDAMVDAAARFLTSVSDYRAFTPAEGYFHGVAHGADFALQLALNGAVNKAQLDRLLAAIAIQIAPKDPTIAYWAGEPDRLARAVMFIAQRKLHADDEWKAWFATVMNPTPLVSWDAAFQSEPGIRKHHNVRAFLLSVFASATSSEDSGVKQLAGPARESLKLVP
jgi:hypothetical protein